MPYFSLAPEFEHLAVDAPLQHGDFGVLAESFCPAQRGRALALRCSAVKDTLLQ
jgi:hypothetical protein